LPVERSNNNTPMDGRASRDSTGSAFSLEAKLKSIKLFAPDSGAVVLAADHGDERHVWIANMREAF
jgi:hypothetical protein